MNSTTTTQITAPDAKRRAFDNMLRALLIALFIFTGVAGFLMMWMQLSHLHWFVRGLLALIYVGACELLVGLMIYGLKHVFSSIFEITLGIVTLLVMVGVVSTNVICHFRAAVFGFVNNATLMQWLTWGAALVPVFGIVIGVLLVMVSPQIRKMRADRRRQGRQFDWTMQARTEAYDSEPMKNAQAIISTMMAKAEALQNLQALRAQMPPALLPEFDQMVTEKFGTAKQSAAPTPPPAKPTEVWRGGQRLGSELDWDSAPKV